MIPEDLRQWAYGVSTALIGSLGVASFGSMLQPPIYESSMQFLVEPNATALAAVDTHNENEQPLDSHVDIDYVTQITLMRSPQFVAQAIESLEREQPDLCQHTEVRADCVKDFQNRLTITQLKEGGTTTRVVEVVFRDEAKNQSFEFLLALQKSYRMYNVQQQSNHISDRLAIFDHQFSTGEEIQLQSTKVLQQPYTERELDFSRAVLLTNSSDYSSDYDSDYSSEIEEETQLKGESASLDQRLQLRQDIAYELVQSGFTWELVEYPMTGRRVSPKSWHSLVAGITLGCLSYKLLTLWQKSLM